jgi:hypothetical protein
MAEHLPIRKFIRVWVMKRKNNARKNGKAATISYTLQWEVYGRKSVMSLGRGATRAFAKRMATEKENELNSESETESLAPIYWSDSAIKADVVRGRRAYLKADRFPDDKSNRLRFCLPHRLPDVVTAPVPVK